MKPNLPRIDVHDLPNDKDNAAISAKFAIENLVTDRLCSANILAQLSAPAFAEALMGAVDRYLEAVATLDGA